MLWDFDKRSVICLYSHEKGIEMNLGNSSRALHRRYTASYTAYGRNFVKFSRKHLTHAHIRPLPQIFDLRTFHATAVSIRY